MPVQQERRLAKRKTLERLTYIDLPSHNGGIVTDVSEGGLGFHAIAPVENGGPIHFSFSGGSQRIAGIGELTWTDGKKKVGGLRFIEVPEEIREQIRNWPLESNLRFRAVKATAPASRTATGPLAVPSNPGATPLTPPAPQVLPKSGAEPSINPAHNAYAPYFPHAAAPETPLGRRSSRLPRAIAICSLLGFIGVASYLCFGEVRGWLAASKSRPEAGTAAQNVRSSQARVPQASAAPGASSANDARPPGEQAPAKIQTPPVADEKLFVQVAAYTRQADALNLVDSLRQQQFIAFVKPPVSDVYYRVQLGPYTTLEAAQIGKRELEKAGFTPFIRH